MNYKELNLINYKYFVMNYKELNLINYKYFVMNYKELNLIKSLKLQLKIFQVPQMFGIFEIFKLLIIKLLYYVS